MVWRIEFPRLVQCCLWIEEELGCGEKTDVVALEGGEKKMVSVHVVERTDGEGTGSGYDGLTFLGLVSGKPHFNE